MIDKTSLRRSLVRRMESLLASADDTIRKLKVNHDEFPDPFDQAALEVSKNIELSCRLKDWDLLLDIKETILRIDHGLFGMCDHCGRQISPKRLRVAPMSRLCVDCQEKMENRKKKIRHVNRESRSIAYNHA